jgi:hypothetical protein
VAASAAAMMIAIIAAARKKVLVIKVLLCVNYEDGLKIRDRGWRREPITSRSSVDAERFGRSMEISIAATVAGRTASNDNAI